MAMWRWRLVAVRSRSLDRGAKGCAEPGERVAQAVVRDAAHAFGEPRDNRRIGAGWARLPGAPGERGLADLDAPDRAPAEEAVHLLDDLPGEELDLQRH